MKKTNMISVFLALVFCVFGFTTANAQLPGPGVDPNSVIMDHGIESGSITGWRATSVDRGQTQSVTVADAQLGDPIKFGRYALKLTVDYTTAQPDQTITSGFITQTTRLPATQVRLRVHGASVSGAMFVPTNPAYKVRGSVVAPAQ